MVLGVDIYFEVFLMDLNVNEKKKALWSTLQKPTLFLKHKVNHIWKNVFSIQVRLMWEANTYAQYVLDPYFDIAYCTSYLTKVNKFVTQEM
jgi:hypothetical protein